MRLLDVATVKQGTGEWYRGWETDSRACAIAVNLADACDPEQGGVLLDGGGTTIYTTLPFGIVGELDRPVNCMRDDDESWVNEAIVSVQEYALGRALVVESVAGTEAWIGADAVTEEGTGDPAADIDFADEIAVVRKVWFTKAVNPDGDPLGQPIMHVQPSFAPALVRAGVLAITTDGLVSVWGDQVVVNAGYEYTDNPPVFFSGPITIYLSSVETGGLLVSNRNNKTRVIATQIAVVDMDPCAIVRYGPMAAGTGKLQVVATPGGDASTFDVVVYNGTGTITVDFGDGTATATVLSGEVVSHTYAMAGNFTVTAVDTDQNAGQTSVSVQPALDPVP
jgi:hypothetical protein